MSQPIPNPWCVISVTEMQVSEMLVGTHTQWICKEGNS